MTTSTIKKYIDHDFGNQVTHYKERKTKWVTIVTCLMMVIEVIAGIWSGSMALLADGIHMGIHAVALALATLAYYFTRKYATDRSFSWGSGKINGLVGYTNAIFLGFTVIWIVYESLERLLYPIAIHHAEAIVIALLGFVVNVVSVIILLKKSPNLMCAQSHQASHHILNEDQNFQAVVMHVLADALTSIGALIGIAAAWFWHWNWLDPMVGLLASVLIFRWCLTLLKNSASVLLDKEASSELRRHVIEALKSVNPGVEIVDLHIWSVGLQSWVVVAIVYSSAYYSSDDYRHAIGKIRGVHHPIVEIQLL